MIPLDGSDTTSLVVASGDVGNAVFSPDDRWLAYESRETGQLEIYVVSFPDLGAMQQVSLSGGRKPRWAPRIVRGRRGRLQGSR